MTATTKKPPKGKGQKRRRARRNNTMLYVGLGVLALLGVVAIIVFSNQPSTPVAEIEGVQTFPNLERGHSTSLVNYTENPPVGGVHDPVWLNCGVYSTPVRDENAVHSLEHGAIWITYQPELPAEELQKLQDLTRQSSYRLLSPYPGISSPIVASAWGYQIQLESADDPRLDAFIQKYEQNPFGPEPGASCRGGTGEPV